MYFIKRLFLPISLILVLLSGHTAIFAQPTGTMTRVMIGLVSPQEFDQGASSASVSNDGRYVAFSSASTNIVPGDTNGNEDVFVYDSQTGINTRVSVSSEGIEPNNLSFSPVISGNGHYVAFVSLASNLVLNDTNNQSDVFVHNRQTGDTTRVSVDSNGDEVDHQSLLITWIDISDDGRYVVFESSATNLVLDDTNNQSDVFVHDRQTGDTTRVSVNSDGDELIYGADTARISGNGQFVMFTSPSPDVVENDTNNQSDVFVRDMQTGEVTRVSVSSSGAEAFSTADIPLTMGEDISYDGRYVTFVSSADNLIVGDTNSDAWDQFWHDRQTGQTIRVSVSSTNTQANDISGGGQVSDDGRYVFFESLATNLVLDDTNNVVDVFQHDIQTATTTHISVNSSGNEGDGDSGNLVFSQDMRYLIFVSDAGNFVPNDTNVAPDIFIIDRQVSSLVAPTLILPSDMSVTVNTNVNFSWNAVSGATQYQIQIASDSAFTTLVHTHTLTTTSYSYSLPATGTYYWRVRANNQNYGLWSGLYQLTLQPLPAPTLLSPAERIATTFSSIDLNWSSVEGATEYQLQIAPNITFTNLVVDIHLTNTNYTFTFPQIGNYAWRVRAKNGAIYGDWITDPYYWYIMYGPIYPSLLGDLWETVITLSPDYTRSFTWINTATVEPLEYEFQIATDNQFVNIIHTQNIVNYSYITVEYNRRIYTYTYSLPNPNNYYWRIRAITPYLTSPWRSAGPNPIVVSDAPGNFRVNRPNEYTPTISFVWDALPNATEYRFQIATDENFTNLLHDTTLSTLSDTYTFPNTGTYYARVRGKNATLTGNWRTTFVTVKPLTAPQLISPAHMLVTDNPNILFRLNIFHYPYLTETFHLQVARDSGFTDIVHEYNTPSSASLDYTYFFPQSGTYYARLRSIYMNLSGLWSPVYQFTILANWYLQNYIINEQQLFNMAQPYLTADMTFALFDITPTGIITTMQFSDGGVVTGTINMTSQNGLITITLNGLSGGTSAQQQALYEHLPSIIMTILDETLPDDYLMIETLTLLGSTISVGVARPNP